VPQSVIDTRKNRALMAQLSLNIARLRVSRAFRAPLTKPSCAKDTPPGLVHRTFHYKDDRKVTVTCHAKVMVGLMRAMRQSPGIEVTASSDSAYSGSYRSYQQQFDLYQAWIQKAPGAHKAADPCFGYHRRGRALDILNASDKDKAAMTAVRVAGERFENGASFGDPPHWTLGALG
jgi:LAS superfamily LD-carboxypeptidase LdcB